MNSLAKRQDEFLQALWLQPHEAAVNFANTCDGLIAGSQSRTQWQRGLKAYRGNGLEVALRALAGAYPVVAQLLGEDNFRALAHSLWLADPPRRGDIAQWGAAAPAHMETLADLCEQEPFMADVARAEWLLHVAATAADAVLDPASFELLTKQDPAELSLVLAPGAACLRSRYPVVSIVNAHLAGVPTLEEAGSRIRAGVQETVLVWRDGYKPRVREAAPDEASFIEALQERRSLADSLEAAPELDFNSWLTAAVQSGLLIGAAAP